MGVVPIYLSLQPNQQPAAAVPCGFATSGLPVSMQIVGAKYSDALVLRAAYAYEASHPFVVTSGNGQVQILSSSQDRVPMV